MTISRQVLRAHTLLCQVALSTYTRSKLEDVRHAKDFADGLCDLHSKPFVLLVDIQSSTPSVGADSSILERYKMCHQTTTDSYVVPGRQQ